MSFARLDGRGGSYDQRICGEAAIAAALARETLADLWGTPQVQHQPLPHHTQLLTEATGVGLAQSRALLRKRSRRTSRTSAARAASAIRLGSVASFQLTPGRTLAWQGKCERRPPRYTIRWDELPVAVAQG